MMNAVRKFLAKLKFNKSLTIEIVWTSELVFSAILISLLLLGDLWLYKNFVLDKRSANAAENKAVSLKKNNLKKIGEQVRAEKAFLENPAFIFTRDPFK